LDDAIFIIYESSFFSFYENVKIGALVVSQRNLAGVGITFMIARNRFCQHAQPTIERVTAQT
jgi:hypothetical protein